MNAIGGRNCTKSNISFHLHHYLSWRQVIDVRDWNSPVTHDITSTPGGNQKEWFYHRALWYDVNDDGRMDAITNHANRDPDSGMSRPRQRRPGYRYVTTTATETRIQVCHNHANRDPDTGMSQPRQQRPGFRYVTTTPTETRIQVCHNHANGDPDTGTSQPRQRRPGCRYATSITSAETQLCHIYHVCSYVIQTTTETRIQVCHNHANRDPDSGMSRPRQQRPGYRYVTTTPTETRMQVRHIYHVCSYVIQTTETRIQVCHNHANKDTDICMSYQGWYSLITTVLYCLIVTIILCKHRYAYQLHKKGPELVRLE